MVDFTQILAAGRNGTDGLQITIPESWHQGRTAYGGLSSALCLAAAYKVAPEGIPPLRSAQVAMMAPVAGDVTLSAQVKRQGRNATWISAQIHGQAGWALSANFVFMGPVASELEINSFAVPDGIVAVDDARGVAFNRFTPAFLANHFEARYAVPPSAEKRPEIWRWVRLKERQTLDPILELLLIGDALPPGVMPLLPVHVPVSTMHWQTGMLTARPHTQDGWWLLRSTSEYAQQGCSTQQMGIWNKDCTPVATGMQSIAIFG